MTTPSVEVKTVRNANGGEFKLLIVGGVRVASYAEGLGYYRTVYDYGDITRQEIAAFIKGGSVTWVSQDLLNDL